MPPLSDAKLQSNNRYLQRVYEIVSVKTRRDECYNERIDAAAKLTGRSKRQFIIDALKHELERAQEQSHD